MQSQICKPTAELKSPLLMSKQRPDIGFRIDNSPYQDSGKTLPFRPDVTIAVRLYRHGDAVGLWGWPSSVGK
jgi:hypothetical protein